MATIDTKAKKSTPDNIRDCATLGEVLDFIGENYDLKQEISSTGRAMIGGYLKGAKVQK